MGVVVGTSELLKRVYKSNWNVQSFTYRSESCPSTCGKGCAGVEQMMLWTNKRRRGNTWIATKKRRYGVTTLKSEIATWTEPPTGMGCWTQLTSCSCTSESQDHHWVGPSLSAHYVQTTTMRRTIDQAAAAIAAAFFLVSLPPPSSTEVLLLFIFTQLEGVNI